MGKPKHSYQYVKEYIEGKGYRLLSKDYKNGHCKLEIRCPKHGVYEQSFAEFKAGHECQRCGIERRAHNSCNSIDNVRDVFSKAGLTLLDTEKHPTAQSYKCECPVHGVVMASYWNVKRSGMCPLCGIHRSGDNNPAWKGGTTDVRKMLRGLLEPWKIQCMKEKNYRCELTGRQGTLNVHHMISFEEILSKTLVETGLNLRDSMDDYSEEEIEKLTSQFLTNNKMLAHPVVMLETIHQQFHAFCGGNSKPTTYRQLERFRQSLANGTSQYEN